MRATFLVVVAHAAALAVSCAAGSLVHAEESESCVSTVTELVAENAALRKSNERLVNELDECRAESVKQPLVWRPFTEGHDPGEPPQHHRKALSTPGPTPLTPVPSYAPSVSASPTSEEWRQLAAAVADTSSADIIVYADITFPSQSPITIGSDRSVSIVGRFADDDGRVTLNGLSDSRLFLVKTGGTLYLTNLNLVNGSAPDPKAASCVSNGGDLELCNGGAIFVDEHGSLVMTSCDIRGLGAGFLNADYGAGIYVVANGATVSIHNATFENLAARYGTAIAFHNTGEEESSQLISHGCRFVNNYAADFSIVHIYLYNIYTYFYDCVWLNNEGVSFALRSTDNAVLSEIRGCVFRDNLVALENGRNEGGAVQVSLGCGIDIFDSIFENNVGPGGGSGGAVHAGDNSFATLVNCTFIQNTAYAGGAFAAVSAASLTAIGCKGSGNTASEMGGNFYADAGKITIINSVFTEAYAGTYAGVGLAYEDSIIILQSSVFSDSYTSNIAAGFYLMACDVSVTDCVFLNNEAANLLGTFYVHSGSNLHIVRTRIVDNRAAKGYGGCLYVSAQRLANFNVCK